MIRDAPTDHIARVLMEAKRPFGAHVSLAPNSGVRADIPGAPLWATFGLMRRSKKRCYSIDSSAGIAEC
jgi:hypothetical protein